MRETTITLNGSILVCDVLIGLESKLSDDLFDRLDAELANKSDQRIDFDDIEVLAIDAIDACDDAGQLPEPESLSYELDQGDVQDLAAAIRRGDKTEAEILLDRVFASDETVSEWVQRGRYGAKARAVTEAPRKAA